MLTWYVLTFGNITAQSMHTAQHWLGGGTSFNVVFVGIVSDLGVSHCILSMIVSAFFQKSVQKGCYVCVTSMVNHYKGTKWQTKQRGSVLVPFHTCYLCLMYSVYEDVINE